MSLTPDQERDAHRVYMMAVELLGDLEPMEVPDRIVCAGLLLCLVMAQACEGDQEKYKALNETARKAIAAAPFPRD